MHDNDSDNCDNQPQSVQDTEAVDNKPSLVVVSQANTQHSDHMEDRSQNQHGLPAQLSCSISRVYQEQQSGGQARVSSTLSGKLEESHDVSDINDVNAPEPSSNKSASIQNTTKGTLTEKVAEPSSQKISRNISSKNQTDITLERRPSQIQRKGQSYHHVRRPFLDIAHTHHQR